jgi:hypothetical protein
MAEHGAQKPQGQGPQHHAALLALMLLSGGWKPRPTVSELRRRARHAGWRMTRNGRPIRSARRAELLELLAQGEAA